MANYWIFVSVPFTDFNVGTIHEMLDRIKTSQKWSIGNKPFMGKLSFIKNTKYLGIYLQGGVVKITEEDYQKILRKSGIQTSEIE